MDILKDRDNESDVTSWWCHKKMERKWDIERVFKNEEPTNILIETKTIIDTNNIINSLVVKEID